MPISSQRKTIYRPEYIRFLKVLKNTRETRGLSQSELGMLVGQDQTYVSKYEKAIRRLDIIETMDICTALEIDMLTFLETIKGVKHENWTTSV